MTFVRNTVDRATFASKTALFCAALAAAPLLLAPSEASAGLRATLWTAQADLDGDGAVSREEVRRFREGRFSEADRSGDGVLDASDAPNASRGAARFQALFSGQDANQDGVVTFEEFSTGPMPVFDAADANQDDVLTGAEIEAFVAMALSN